MRRQSAIDRHTLWEKIGYVPHGPEQIEFHDSTARFRAPICGRRFGKSTMAAVDMIEACFIPDSIYWICGDNYSQAEKEFRIVLDAFTNRKKLNIGHKLKVSNSVNQGNMRIEFPWNTTLMCTSASNPSSLLGEGLNGVIMSESAEHKKETWEKYIQPALSDNSGWATFPTTPKGFNWIYDIYMYGQDPLYPNYFSQSYPTWLNTAKYPGGFDPVNCFVLDPMGEKIFHPRGICKCNEELVDIWRTASTPYWNQQYAAMFTNIQGNIYDEFLYDTHVRAIPFNKHWRNFWVFDWGFTAPFVCLDIMLDPNDNVYIWREYQVAGLSTLDHGSYLQRRENPEGFHVDCMFGDPSGADAMALLAPILGQIFSERVPWEQGIEYVKRWLKIQENGLPKLFIDPSCTNLIRQMQALRKPQEKEGKNPKENQVDYDDHGPDALRYFFSQFFILGYGSSLSDVYTPNDRKESNTFFQNEGSMTLGERIRL